MRGEILVWLVDPISQAGSKLIQRRDRGKIAVRPTGIADIMDTVSDGQPTGGLPTIAHIPREAGIKLTARGEAKLRKVGEETLAVAHQDVLHRIVKRVANTARKRTASGKGFGRGAENRTHGWGDAEELREAAPENAVYSDSVTQIVGAKGEVPVILSLLIALESRLGSKDICPGTKGLSSAQTGEVEEGSNDQRDAGGRIGHALGRISDGIAEFHVAHTELVYKASL